MNTGVFAGFYTVLAKIVFAMAKTQPCVRLLRWSVLAKCNWETIFCAHHRSVECLWNQLPKELRLPTDHEEISLSSDLTCQFVISFITTVTTFHYCFSSTPGSKLIFSTNTVLHSSSTFPPTGMTPQTPAVFRFSRACWF